MSYPASETPVPLDPANVTDGLPAGWGQLTAAGVSRASRISNLVLNLEFRTPYLTGVQSSNVASHIVRSMVQSGTGNAMTGRWELGPLSSSF